MTIRVYDIDYDLSDIDGEAPDLTDSLVFDDVEEDDLTEEGSIRIADRISDKTGFCVHGFQYLVLSS